MAIMTVSGITEITEKMRNGMKIPESVLDSMLDAQAEVVIKAQKRTARTMLKGPYSTGGTEKSIGPGKKTGLSDGKKMTVEFKGSRKRGNTTTRNAEIAFINEYGKKNQPARPFITKANEQCAAEAEAAAEKIFNKWQEKTL